MPNYYVERYQIQSPYVVIKVNFLPEETVQIRVCKLLVDNGSGGMTITFSNRLDFRSKLQIDMSKILDIAFKDIIGNYIVHDATFEDRNHTRIPMHDDDVEGEWIVNQSGMRINGVRFDLPTLKCTFKITEDQD
jgi:hypothetical protein